MITEYSTGIEWQRLRFANRQRCPKCASLIYSRKSALCGVCGIELPESMRLDSGERRRLLDLLEDERSRHRQWISRHGRPPALRLKAG